jgi:tRNA threonylcarbamoyladenosine biosynthesis protein TsaB
MRILGIDTAIPTASVALTENGELLAEAIYGSDVSRENRATAQRRGNHAEAVLPLIGSLLEKAQITLQQLSGIAVSIGPGSFTGLRVGLATAKGIAYESGLPVVGISTLQANAARVKNFNGIIASLLDARKGEVYIALFRCDGINTKRLMSDAVASIKSAIDLVRDCSAARNSSLLLIGNGAKAYERQWVDALGPTVLISTGCCYPSVASQVATLAGERFVTGTVDDVGALTPVYLRLSEAESKRGLELTC